MLDSYTTGRVHRISPEAPVPVMEVVKQESRPGGAGNAALNFSVLGGMVTMLGRIGQDPSGLKLQESLSAFGIDVQTALFEQGYATPIKNRLIADSQQLLRIDHEVIAPIQSETEEKALCSLKSLLPHMQLVAISDYGKGFLSNRLLAETIQLANALQIPTIVDPKGKDFSKYRGATLIKPNLSEAYAAAHLPLEASLDEAAKKILDLTCAKMLLITRSEAGMSLFEKEGRRRDFPVSSREVKDVTGAGDTALAVIGLGMANHLEMGYAVQLANVAAGIAIERVGCIQVRLSEIAQRILESDRRSKVFEEGHSAALHHLMENQGYRLFVVGPDTSNAGRLYRAIQNLTIPLTQEHVIVYAENSHPNEDLIHLLSSLQNIQSIILQKRHLERFCAILPPKEVLYLEKT